jgi:hypothetical protein
MLQADPGIFGLMNKQALIILDCGYEDLNDLYRTACKKLDHIRENGLSMWAFVQIVRQESKRAKQQAGHTTKLPQA